MEALAGTEPRYCIPSAKAECTDQITGRPLAHVHEPRRPVSDILDTLPHMGKKTAENKKPAAKGNAKAETSTDKSKVYSR